MLFREAPGAPPDVDLRLDDAGRPVTVDLSVVPARCDSHALAEDKVGTLFGVRVRGEGLADDAAFYLPLERAQRSALFTFFRSHCGLG